MKKNALQELRKLGQNIWLDYWHRGMLEDGEFQRLLTEDGITGVTTNASLFQQALADREAYGAAMDGLAALDLPAEEIYRRLVVEDAQAAADLLEPIHTRSDGRDGYVCLAVNPQLTHDSDATTADGLDLWTRVKRPNLMIKVPATDAGLLAIRHLTAEGVNTNATLIFDPDRYEQAAEAYVSGLQARLQRSEAIRGITGAASVLVGRIDRRIDAMIREGIGQNPDRTELAGKLEGSVGIAVARQSHMLHKRIFGEEPFRRPARAGGNPQRLVWASTGPKSARYDEHKYVDALVGADTIVAMRPATLDSYRERGKPARRLEENLDQARYCLDQMPAADIDVSDVGRSLEDEGIRAFATARQVTLQQIEARRESAAR